MQVLRFFQLISHNKNFIHGRVQNKLIYIQKCLPIQMKYIYYVSYDICSLIGCLGLTYKSSDQYSGSK